MAAEEIIVKFKGDVSDLTKDLNNIKHGLGGVDSSIKDNEKSLSGFNRSLSSIGTKVAAVFAVSQLINFGKEVIRITGEFQKFEAVLTNTLGSKGLARNILEQIRQFAATTPFAVRELTNSFIKLANRGVTPTIEQMKKIGDVASTLGKDFEQVVEAIIDVNNSERWRELGISAQQAGDKMIFAFRGTTIEADKTVEGVTGAISKIGEFNGIAGQTEAVSKTLQGQVSNLGDAFDNLLVSLGNLGNGGASPAINALTALLNVTSEFLTNLNKAQSTTEKFLGKKAEISGFTKERIEKENNALLELEKSYIDAIFEVNNDKIVARDKALASIQKLIPRRLKDINDEIVKEQDRFAKEIENPKALGISVSKKREESLLIRLYGLDQQKKFIENELPNLLRQYKDQLGAKAVAESKAKASAQDLNEENKKMLGAYAELNKQISDLETKISNDSVLGIFKKDDIDNLTFLKNKLKDVNAEILRRNILASDIEKLDAKGAVIPELKDFEIGELKTKEDKKIEITKKSEEQIRKEREDTFWYSVDLINQLAQISQNQSDQRLIDIDYNSQAEQNLLDLRLEQGIISQKQYQDATKKLAIDTNIAIRKEQQKQAEQQKLLSAFNVITNTAAAIAKVTAQTGVAAPFTIPLIAAIGAAQLATIYSAPIPKYEKGGKIKGKRHRDGGHLIEAEGGEYIQSIPVTNKYIDELEAMRKNTYNQIINRKYIAPALKKQKEKYEQSLASNIYKSMQLNASLNDDNLLMSDMKTRQLLKEISLKLDVSAKVNLRYRNV